MDTVKFKKKYKGIKMNLYVPLLEQEVKDIIHTKNDWMETSLDLQEQIDNKLYRANITRYYCWWSIILVLLCGIFVGFNYLIIRLFGV